VLTLDTAKGAVLKTEMLPLSADILNPVAGMWSSNAASNPPHKKNMESTSRDNMESMS
jgi:hypothetical protein